METLFYATLDSDVGELGALTVVWTAKGLCRILFADARDGNVLEADLFLKKHFPKRRFVEGSKKETAKIASFLKAYRRGEAEKSSFPLDLRGTEFQRAVWTKIARIPYGKTRSYADLARACHKPKAARAVGQATGRNPLPVLIGCHRVLGTTGTLTGFTGGLEKKRTLLRHEGIAWS